MDHRFLTVNGIRMHCVIEGTTGPLVVLLHGFPEFWYSWRRQIPALSGSFRVAAPDLRGYGETEKPARGYDLDTLSDDVRGLIRALGEERAAVVGHDWGGAIAYHCARRHGDAVDRLAVLNAPHPAHFLWTLLRSPSQLRKSWYMFFFQIPRLPEAYLLGHGARRIAGSIMRGAVRREAFTREDLLAYRQAALIPGAVASGIEYYRQAFRGAFRTGAARGGKKFDGPACIIWGEDDPFLGRELTEGLDRFISGRISIRFIPRCGHWVQQEAPEEVNRILLEFLGRPLPPRT